MVAVVDAPSDRQDPPFLAGFRQTTEHVADIKAVIAWLKHKSNIPVWLVGTSRGTQSVAYIATQLAPADGGPDGIVLTSTILSDKKGRPVTEMPIGRINVPTLVVHHRNDGCNHCRPEELPRLTEKLTAVPRKELLMFDGGEDKGDPCEAAGHHGFAAIEQDVVAKIAGPPLTLPERIFSIESVSVIEEWIALKGEILPSDLCVNHSMKSEEGLEPRLLWTPVHSCG